MWLFVSFLEGLMAPPIRTRSVYAPSQPVPLAMRQFQGRDVFALWFSLGLGLLTVQTHKQYGAIT